MPSNCTWSKLNLLATKYSCAKDKNSSKVMLCLAVRVLMRRPCFVNRVVLAHETVCDYARLDNPVLRFVAVEHLVQLDHVFFREAGVVGQESVEVEELLN